MDAALRRNADFASKPCVLQHFGSPPFNSITSKYCKGYKFHKKEDFKMLKNRGVVPGPVTLFQDLNFQEYQIAVGHSKELISRIEPEGVNTQHPEPEIFTQEKLDWMMLALDGYLVSKDFVIAVTAFDGASASPQIGEPKFDAMVSKARAVNLALVRLDKQPIRAAEAADSKTSVLEWSWHEKMKMLLDGSEIGQRLADSVHLCASRLFDQAAELKRALAKATLQQHDPDSESSWKAGLDTNADLKTVFNTVQEQNNISAVDGEAVQAAVDGFTKASLGLHRLHLIFHWLWYKGLLRINEMNSLHFRPVCTCHLMFFIQEIWFNGHSSHSNSNSNTLL